MAREVTATEDWLSYALAEYDDERIAAANKRAEVAVRVRLDQRVSRFLKQSEDMDELGARLDAVDDTVEEIVNEVATQYNADPELMYEAAVRKIAYDFGVPFGTEQQGTPPSGFSSVPCQSCGKPAPVSAACPHCGFVNQAGQAATTGIPRSLSLRDRVVQQGVPRGASTRTADGAELLDKPKAYEYERISPDGTLGEGAEAVSQSYEYNSDVDDTLGDSKDHPRELQDIKQYVEDRRTINDDPDKDVGVERAVDHTNPDTPVGPEQKGKGGTFGQGNQAAPVTSKFHILGLDYEDYDLTSTEGRDAIRRDRFADPSGDSALHPATRGNPRNVACPSCGMPNAITAADKARGYPCEGCARSKGGY